MGIHTADAIVLRCYPYRETSALVSCLTDRFGKVKGIIKGLRGANTKYPKYRSAMEPMTLNRIVFYDTRSSALHLITQCDLLEAYQEIAQELDVMRLAATCVELTDMVIEPDEPQSLIFQLLKDTLGRLASGERRLAPVRIHFILRLLRLAGFQPQLDDCIGCNQRPRDWKGFWSARQGGLLCERCLHQDPQAEMILPAVLEAFVECAEADGPHRVNPAQTTAIRRYLDQFLQWRLDRPLKTTRMA